LNAKETRKLAYYKNKSITQYEQQQQQRKQTQIPRINNETNNENLTKKKFLPKLNRFSLGKVTAFNKKDETTKNDQQQYRKPKQISKMCNTLRNEQRTIIGKEFLPNPNGLSHEKATGSNEKIP
jgi:hypothetical protein